MESRKIILKYTYQIPRKIVLVLRVLEAAKAIRNWE